MQTIRENFNLANSSINSHEVVVRVNDCDEETSIQKIDDSSNINLRAAAIHVIGDFIQSIGVLIAALIIYFKVN